MGLQNRLKQVLWNLAYSSGFLRLLEKVKARPDYRGIIFYYHRVHPKPGWDPLGLNIVPSHFYKQVSLLKKKMQVVTLKEFVSELRTSTRTSAQPPRAVITFDDGYRDVWVYAWPVLKQFSVSPTLFLCIDPLIQKKFLVYDRLIPWVQSDTRKELLLKGPDGSGRSYPIQTLKGKKHFVQEATQLLMRYSRDDRESFFEQYQGAQKKYSSGKVQDLYLSLEEVKAALGEGAEVGSHTVAHPDLPRMALEEWDVEIKGSKQMLESFLGTRIDFFSYPAGQNNSTLRDKVREAGYLGAVATGKRAVMGSHFDRYALPRISPEGIVALGKFYAQVSGIRPEWFKEGDMR
jgi:peptidoglycan/xylan/chitin deacetylase (PgdA/CDA1 family)